MSEGQDTLVERQEWADKLAELYTWTGSEFAEDKPELYSFLCSLIGYFVAGEEAADRIKQQDAEIARLREDKARLDWLQNESNDLRCFSIPTGGDDADIGWRVVGHYMAKPHERIIGENWHDDLRGAIDDARKRLAEHGAYSPEFAALSQPSSGDKQ